jgi:hypothetical protein
MKSYIKETDTCKTNLESPSLITNISVFAILSLCLLLNPIAQAANGMGMTWKKGPHNNQLGVDRVGCSSCDPYKGETKCSEKRPVLCLKQDAAPIPGVPIVACNGCAMPDPYYNGWAKGHIGLTLPVRGDQLAGVADANDVCKFQFGPGYRMAEFHDGEITTGGNGAWNFYAYGNINNSSRFWVYINDQPSNCWGKGVGKSSNRNKADITALLLGKKPTICQADTYDLKTGIFKAPNLEVDVFNTKLKFAIEMKTINQNPFQLELTKVTPK